MKKIFFLKGVLLCILLIPYFGISQIKTENVKILKQDNGSPYFLDFRNSTNAKSQSNLALSNAKTILQDYLPFEPGHSLQLVITNEDALGFTHQKYQQFYKGIKVEFSKYLVHGKNGILQTANGNFVAISNLDIKPTIDKNTALSKAVFGAKTVSDIQERSKGELVIYPNTDRSGGKLAYKFRVITTDYVSSADVYVDAHTGAILFKSPLAPKHNHGENLPKSNHDNHNLWIAQGTAETQYNGSRTIETDQVSGGYRLFDTTRGGGIHVKNNENSINADNATFDQAPEFVDNDNKWTQTEWVNTDHDIAGVDALWSASMAYDYYKNKHGRDSYDNKGQQIKILVHFGTKLDNAFFDLQSDNLILGDGSKGTLPFTDLFTVSHEMTHGVIDKQISLFQGGESGALSEGLPDVMAASIIHHTTPTKEKWIVGFENENIFRNIKDPKSTQNPNTYKGEFYKDNPNSANSNHLNSTIISHCFYILSEGKSGTNDNNDNYTVNGIGIENADKIFYRAINTYMVGYTDFEKVRINCLEAAKDIYGENSNEWIQTANSFYAVGVGEQVGSNTCAAPEELTANTITSSKATLNWKNVTDAQGYTVQYRKTGGVWESVNTTSNSITISNLTAGTNYEFQVKTKCSSSTSGLSISISFKTLENTDTETPSAPTNLNTSNIKENSLTISWTASTDNIGVTGYDVYQGNSLVTSVTTTSANITGLIANTSYQFKVKAKDAAGNISDFSNTIEATTTGIGGGDLCEGVEVWDPSKLYQAGDRMIYGGRLYEMKISGNWSDIGACGTKSLMEITSVSKNEIFIFPNPATEILVIKGKQLKKGYYEIISLSGKQERTGLLKTPIIDIRDLSKGLYILTIIDENGTFSKRFIKD